MDPQLKAYLWKHPSVRQAFKKEIMRLSKWILIYVVTIGVFRYVTERPIKEGLLSAAIGAAVVTLIWLFSVIRTVKASIDENT